MRMPLTYCEGLACDFGITSSTVYQIVVQRLNIFQHDLQSSDDVVLGLNPLGARRLTLFSSRNNLRNVASITFLGGFKATMVGIMDEESASGPMPSSNAAFLLSFKRQALASQ